VSIPIVNLLEETACYVKTLDMKRVCLLATDGTIKSRLFHDAFEKNRIEVVTLPDHKQADLMEIIYDIKRGETISPTILSTIVSNVCDDTVDAMILGCTELCIQKRDRSRDSGTVLSSPVLINILEVLAEASIAFCKTGKD
jgi:aspartate racemase